METSEPPERGADDVGQSPDDVGQSPDAAGHSPDAAGHSPDAAGHSPDAAGHSPDAAGHSPDAAGEPIRWPRDAAKASEDHEVPEDHEHVAVAERAGRRGFAEVVHLWIPLSIVLVSVLAAVMGWRASVADESATHTEELSRQNLVQQQQLLIEDNDAVNTDIRTYGQFAQYSELAHSLLRDAGQVGGKVGGQLLAEGQADLGITHYLGKQIRYLSYGFDPSSPTGNSSLASDGTLLPGNAYNAALALSVAENQDVELHGLAPEQLHSQAEAERTTGVRLTGIAALFVAVMVLLTVAALITGTLKLWLTGTGAVLTIAGLVLFALVELS